jgi:hypothetical protein
MQAPAIWATKQMPHWGERDDTTVRCTVWACTGAIKTKAVWHRHARSTMRHTLVGTLVVLAFTLLTFAQNDLPTSGRMPRAHLSGDRTTLPALCRRASETQ